MMTTHDESCFCNQPPGALPINAGRRRFIRLATLGSGAAALFGLAAHWRLAQSAAGNSAMAEQTAEALLLSCMDYRLVDDITKYMDSRGMTNRYDHIVLEGASLGAMTTDFKSWNKTFWEHLKIASDLHHIKKVILLDHRDCSAYKTILKADFSKDPALETRVHGKYLHDLAKEIRKRYPQWVIETLLMNLDGTVETVA